jgi:RNA polymerase sigma-70 factor (ECF subfamily)
MSMMKARPLPAPLSPDEPPACARPSFEEIYQQHFRFVWQAAAHLGVERTFRDDVVQETFVVAHRRLADFEGRSTVRTWLYGIVRRVAADHRRTLRRKPCGGGPVAPSTEAKAPDASVEEAEEVRLLQRLLQQLDEPKREVFILAELAEMTLAEIAEVVGSNPNTVATRLRAARRELEAALLRSPR